MTKKFTVALDCMGGDRAPQIVIEGADLIASTNQDIHFLLFGDSKKITPILHSCRYLKGRYTLTHTDEFISSDEKPSVALRKGTNSSMRLAINAVKDGSADVIVSAGNTGALMAIAKIVLRPLPSIDRPAIVTSIPNQKKKGTVMLDMGANIECGADVLFQFAVMGHAFARNVLKIENPTIGVLNVGSEDAKGHEEVRNVAAMLKASTLNDCFHGYVEGDDITKGTVDVVVTDGFTGNITLKAIEGTVKLMSAFIKEALSSSIWSKLGYLLASSAITKSSKQMDPRMHNGAMLVGLNGVVVKSHGSTDRVGFANAIKVAISLVENKINEQITQELKSAVATIEAATATQEEAK
ncbi:MAG: phosphate acyltransferase PlsX [Rickettsiales bacterium]|nr:phosphate acyltransferase PlsX [Rickettsiales bacterium]